MRRHAIGLGLGLLASTLISPIAWAADEDSPIPVQSVSPVEQAFAAAAGDKVYLDVKVEGKPLGRITVQLFADVKIGSERFKDLVVGKGGVSYRLSRVDKILPTYIRCEGPRSLSYSATMESPITGGDSVFLLEDELDAQKRKHNRAGLVSLLVYEKDERPVTERLIARGGKLVTLQQQAGEAPNGTQLMILRAADPELDRTNLIVGQVVEGMAVVEAIAALPYAKPRVEAYDSPFFAAAKAMGDKRAVTAELGFFRPLKRVIISAGGLA